MALVACFLSAAAAVAHDTWVQAAASIVRVGEVASVDVMLGNHGNEHRDFKLAGKPSLDKTATLSLVDPDGKAGDLKPAAVDRGLGEKEGFYTATFRVPKAGLYAIAYTSDKVVTYAPKRSVHSAKAFVLASASLDKPPADAKGYDRVLGHALELVPLTSPVAPLGPGTNVKVKVLFEGKPLAGARVSFIPRGATLAEGFDDKYERKTGDDGVATFEVRDANLYLVATHHETDAKGEGYDSTKYSATLTLNVPAICPCCGE